MIRIDEIYNNTFWPWIRKNCPDLRMFYCDPPGQTDPDALFNHPYGTYDGNNYIFFHDQEPIHLDLHHDLFNKVVLKNVDLNCNNIGRDPEVNWVNGCSSQEFRDWRFSRREETAKDVANSRVELFFNDRLEYFEKFKKANRKLFQNGHVIISEQGECADELNKRYGWKIHYYFYHGWACQDWFRGYDKTFLIPRARDRAPTQTFISPNRIIAGKRDHRVLFLYNVFKQKLDHNWISAPRTCQHEHVDINQVARKYCNIYPDIEQVFDQADLPRLFPGEETQKMASCWLTNFDESADSLVYVPTETVYFGQRLHITEKTFKAIALEMPFILLAPAGSLDYMRSYGFKTFANVFDESYDLETDDFRRVEQVVKLLKELDNLSVKERQQIHQACLPAVEHNFNHFYSGSLTNDYLWPELLNMLKGIR